jgi:hypothetical protein
MRFAMLDLSQYSSLAIYSCGWRFCAYDLSACNKAKAKIRGHQDYFGGSIEERSLRQRLHKAGE